MSQTVTKFALGMMGRLDINDGTGDAAVTIEGKTLAIFECVDGTTWAAIYTANS